MLIFSVTPLICFDLAYNYFGRGARGQRGERGESGPVGAAVGGPMFENAMAPPSAPPVSAPPVSSTSGSNPLQPVEKIRTEFPETWIWLDSFVGYNVLPLHLVIAPAMYSIKCKKWFTWHM